MTPISTALGFEEASPTAVCAHCGQALLAGTRGAYCCAGCEAVRSALLSAGLDRFYALRGGSGEPAAPSTVDTAYLDALELTIANGSAPHKLAFSLQGARCAACVWVLEQLFRRLPGALRIDVNVARGTLELLVASGFPLRRYADAVRGVGYQLGPQSAARSPRNDDLLVRVGVCVALALNAMAFSAALHLGVERGALRDLLRDLSFVAAALSVLIGGPVFFGSAWRSLRAGALHLDVPIALGIALTAAAAAWAYFGHHPQAAYFDSLSAFVALMLVGRYVQERAVERSRAELLDDPGLGALYCRREHGDELQTVRCSELAREDVLLVPRGELLPVAAELVSGEASCSLAWLDGEAEPRAYARGDRLPAGAINIGEEALRVRALEPFAQSQLLSLLRPVAGVHAATQHLSRFAGWYVIAVVALAALGFGAYALLTADMTRALAVATAICVVTCPCAIGIAIPLAYELAHVALRKRGVFVRSTSFLDRARDIRQIAFDKTGTLTTGRLRIANPEAIDELPADAIDALHQLSARSIHPKSLAVRDALAARALPYRRDLRVIEHAGAGLECSIGAHVYRLGRPSFVCASGRVAGDLCLSVDGQLLASLRTAETFRTDAAAEIAALREAGYSIAILSGDDPLRVRLAATQLGVSAETAIGGCSALDKAEWIEAHDAAHTLMVGDGVNDALAMQSAHCGATPAIDRPFLPARTDFYFTTPGLLAIATALQASRDVAAIVGTNVRFAIAYNALAVSAALAGVMQPWLAAIVMPLSSVVVVLRTSAAMSKRSRAWRS